MRIVTWNICHKDPEDAIRHLEPFGFDIAVLTESLVGGVSRGAQRLWFGGHVWGVTVFARGEFRLAALPAETSAPLYFAPVAVDGPQNFTLFAVWPVKPPPYAAALITGLDAYAGLLRDGPCVLAGDFNSSSGVSYQTRSHPDLVRRLHSLGLTSAYHHVWAEEHGAESHETYFPSRTIPDGYHLDYCVIPTAWASGAQVCIGDRSEWRSRSDHMPVFVSVDQTRPATPGPA